MDKNSFFFQAMVYLASAVIMVPVAKKLGLGSVLGYLIAGILIGPAVCHFIGREGQDVMHFAEFGVVMMLFVIGLELEPELLWKLRKSIVGLGGLQVLITGAIIAAGAMTFFDFRWQQALALGMILSLSSTAIVLQTLNEKGLMKTSAGQSSFCVLLFQDIAVIPMLALFPLLATSTPVIEPGEVHGKTLVDGLPGWAQTFIVLGSVAIIILAGRFLIRPLFRIVAGTRLREVFTATALLLIVSIAVLMSQVGLSPALGAFLAGVVLADSEYRHELESAIEPFKGLLLGLFFIAVGASMDFGLIMREPLMVIGLVILIMAVKAVILFILGKIFKLSIDQNIFLAVALSQVGEFGFVLFSLSLQEGVLPKETVDLMVAAAAISMALTPLFLMFNERVIQPRVGTRASEEERESDTIHEKNPVIIAGFGHFGNTIGRFLRAHNIGMTILDNDSDRVDLLRKMGLKVYYGDATRYDLLRSAGAADAKLIIIAIEPADRRLEMIETIKKHFPNLRMMVRASNRFDAYEQMNAGMLHIYRETLDTALRVGVDTMKLLGFRTYEAQRAARLFFKIDEANLKKLSSIRDKEQYVIESKARIEELEMTIRADQQQMDELRDSGWDDEALMYDTVRK